MTDTAKYALTLQGPTGSTCTASLSLSAPSRASADSPAPERSRRAGEREWVYVDPLSGSLLAPDLTGPNPVPLEGLVFVSQYGPPMAYMFQGQVGQASVNLQFNLIDSPGQYLGGGLGFFPEGGGSPVQPYGVLGIREP